VGICYVKENPISESYENETVALEGMVGLNRSMHLNYSFGRCSAWLREVTATSPPFVSETSGLEQLSTCKRASTSTRLIPLLRDRYRGPLLSGSFILTAS